MTERTASSEGAQGRADPGKARPAKPGAKVAAGRPLDGIPLLEDLPDVAGRRVLVRCDFNVPLREVDSAESESARINGVRDLALLNGTAGWSPTMEIADDFRIRAALPTLNWLTERGASVTTCTHLGRPGGKPNPRYDVAPVRERLAELAPGVRLEQNLRFDPGEEANSPTFVDELVDGFDLYVNDAFGASHRFHASVVGPPSRLPSAAGRLLQKEVEMLGGLLGRPARPFVAVVGGAKVSDKLGVLHSLLDRVDQLLVGGAMAFTFLVAAGHSAGDSLVDIAGVEACKSLLDEAGERLLLPTDVLAICGTPRPQGSSRSDRKQVGESRALGGETRPQRGGSSGVLKPDGPSGVLKPEGPFGDVFEEVRKKGRDVPEGWCGLDIGPETAARFREVILGAGTVFWNGPMGKFEDDRFSAGTAVVAQAMAESRAFTVVGGGDSAAALDRLGLAHRVDFVSTGGGASLEFLELGDLPGLAALRAAGNAPHSAR
ncbi:MAG TPA: phosphoglycerate kinase [Acidimicrobiales bacterium]|nr:phosphoglycerate kinase [Acidimicrobiales bacterium]